VAGQEENFDVGDDYPPPEEGELTTFWNTRAGLYFTIWTVC
jgi:hypothetical protein